MKNIINFSIVILAVLSFTGCVSGCPYEKTEYVTIKNSLDAGISLDFRYPNLNDKYPDNMEPIYFTEALKSGELKRIKLRFEKGRGSVKSGAIDALCETSKPEVNQRVEFNVDTLSMYKICRTITEGQPNATDWEYHIFNQDASCDDGYVDVGEGYFLPDPE